jgi:transposase
MLIPFPYLFLEPVQFIRRWSLYLGLIGPGTDSLLIDLKVMNTKLITGIDISKQYFDAAISDGQTQGYVHRRYPNDEQGFKQFRKDLPDHAVCVMEASGPYYLKLATYLYNHGIHVCVVNPLSVKHFSRMRMMRTKTDKKDAAIIAEYGMSEEPSAWAPKEPYELELQQLSALMDSYTRQRTSLVNQQEAFKNGTVQSKVVVKSIKLQISTLEKQIKLLGITMQEIINHHFADLHQRLQTIPGIGKQTSLQLILVSNGFRRFANVKQLAAYIGLCPRIFESGTSIKGRSRICKMGMSHMRKLLYLCAMQAIKCNKACNELYQRIKIKGKSGRLALVAVANKLLRQAFAIGTGNSIYKEI